MGVFLSGGLDSSLVAALLVEAGARVRLRSTIKNVEPVEGNGVRITFEAVIEVEGQSRPAMVAETLGIQYA